MRQRLKNSIASPHYHLCCAGLIWKYKTDALFTYRSKGYPMKLVPYERLVADPTRELKEICSFLNIAWEDSLLRHHMVALIGELGSDGMKLTAVPTRDASYNR